MHYRAELDGIRAFAVLAVMLYHAGVPGLEGGFVGVDVFFVLSGYLICNMLKDADMPDLAAFYIRRTRRILPLMVVVTAGSVVLGWAWLLPHQLKDLGQAAVAAPLFLSNILYWWESGYFTAASAEKPLLHLWSLAVEGQFYLLFPLVFVAARRSGMRIAGLVFLCSGSFLASLWASWNAPDAAYYLLPFRLWELLAGALIAYLPACRTGGVAVIAGATALMCTAAVLDNTVPFPGVAAVPAVLGTGLLIWGSVGHAPARRILSAWPLAYLGKLSYGLYLWHFPVFVYWRLAVPDVAVAGALPILLPAVVVLSWGTYRMVERPWMSANRPPLGVVVPGSAVAAVIAAGVAIHLANGVPARLPAAAAIFGPKPVAAPCHDRTDVQAARVRDWCLIGAPGVAPTLALIGDSHAGHLSAALSDRLAAQGISAISVTGSWCAPLPGFGTSAPARGPGCAALMRATWDGVLAESQIGTVIMAGQWGNYVGGARLGVSPVVYALDDVTGPNRVVFGRAVAALAARLSDTDTDAQLLVLGPLPEFSSHVPDLQARSIWRGGGPASVLRRLDFELRNRAALNALAGLPAPARVIAVDGLFCTRPPMCRVLDDSGAPLFRDSNHLSPAGAQRVVAEILRLMDDPAQTAGGDTWTFTPAEAARPASDRPAVSPDRS